jgi:hypothetical protein
VTATGPIQFPPTGELVERNELRPLECRYTTINSKEEEGGLAIITGCGPGEGQLKLLTSVMGDANQLLPLFVL